MISWHLLILWRHFLSTWSLIDSIAARHDLGIEVHRILRLLHRLRLALANVTSTDLVLYSLLDLLPKRLQLLVFIADDVRGVTRVQTYLLDVDEILRFEHFTQNQCLVLC